jgi:ABC-2 type transport system ATP-binding protein
MIEARGLTKRYGPTTAVDDLSFDVRSGAVTGFLGPNGAGKSTTMRMVLGLDRPTSGRVTINGQTYAELSNPIRTVGALLDAKWVHPNRSARDHLRWMAAAANLPARRVDEVLDVVGLTSVAGKRAGQFSLGMSQRLGIAGALLGDPEVLMFDEPVNGLDPEGILWIRRFMSSLAAEGRTVFVSSHLLSEMALTAEHLIVIGRGRLIADCSTKEFVGQAASGAVLVRGAQEDVLHDVLIRDGLTVDRADGAGLAVTGPEATAERVGELAAAHGLVLHELTLQRASLEEAFMALTGDSVEYEGHGFATTPAQTTPSNDHTALVAAGR